MASSRHHGRGLSRKRGKLQAGEDSPIVENFNGKQLLADLHKKHVE